MFRRSQRLLVFAGCSSLTIGAALGHTAGASPGEDGWVVDTSDCPASATEPIEDEVFIGSAMPRSGGVAAAAFEPAAEGLETFVEYANENDLLDGVTIKLVIGDDQYNPSLTPGVVEDLLDDGAHLFAGIIGTPSAHAVRSMLNEECVPMLNLLTGDPRWGNEVADYPWTTGLLTPYHHEFRGYALSIADQFPGATVGLYYVASEFGVVSAEAFRDAAGELDVEIVAEATVENGDETPPEAQVATLAAAAPDVIVAVPLGAQCISFLGALAEAKAANPGWDPAVFMTNTCAASALIMMVAGENADGVYTSANMGLKDVMNPDVAAEDPEVQAYLAEMEARGKGSIITTGAAGWMAGELTLAVLVEAQASPDGLTRASIINAARNLSVQPSLLREEMYYVTNGESDGYYSEDVQIIQYDAATTHYTEVGEAYSFESSPDGVPSDD